MLFDTVAIKERIDLRDLAGRDTQLKGSTEKHGPCPRPGCDGTDRFHVTATWWFCRQCHPDRGDAIEYIMWRDGATFGEACQVLGGHNTHESSARRPYSAPRATPASEKAATRPRVTHTEAPSAVWQAKARTFAAYCQAQLWETPQALAYLRERGLSDATIKAAGLGWHDKTRWRDPAEWGQRGGKLWLPKGWTISCEMGGVMQYVKVRRPAEDLGERDDKYIAIKGSKKRGVVFGLGSARGHWDVILAEGELNALTLRQELAGAMAVVSVGDAGNVPGSEALAVLATIPRWWALYDLDKAGKDGAANLAAFSDRVRVLDWPWPDLDVNDAHLAGQDLAAWAVPQVGPRDAGKRLAWALHWLGALDAAAGDAGANGKDPSLRVWLALLGEYDGIRESKQARLDKT